MAFAYGSEEYLNFIKQGLQGWYDPFGFNSEVGRWVRRALLERCCHGCSQYFCDDLLEILVIVRETSMNSCTASHSHQFQTYTQLREKFIKQFGKRVYPRLYYHILSSYVWYASCNMQLDLKQQIELLNESIEYCTMRISGDYNYKPSNGINYNNKEREKLEKQWKLIDEYVFVNVTTMERLIRGNLWLDVDSFSPVTHENINEKKKAANQLTLFNIKLSNVCINFMKKYEKTFNLYKLYIHHPSKQINHATPIHLVFNSLSFQLFLDLKMKNSLIEFILNKLGYILVTFPKYNDENHVSKLLTLRHRYLGWMLIGKFYVYRKFNPKLAEKCFRMALGFSNKAIKNPEIDITNKTLLGIQKVDPINRSIEACEELITLYDILIDINNVAKYNHLLLKLLKYQRKKYFEKYPLTYNILTKHDLAKNEKKIQKCEKTLYHWQHWQILQKYETTKSIVKSMQLMESNQRLNDARADMFETVYPVSLTTVLPFAKTFSNNQILQTFINGISIKQCNWNKCMKKSIKLKRCKTCKSVYYCSKKCQKKDWYYNENEFKNHKNHCKHSFKREFTMTVGF